MFAAVKRPLRQSLLAGEKREGWRAVLQPDGEQALPRAALRRRHLS
jgi:hypothetical protein